MPLDKLHESLLVVQGDEEGVAEEVLRGLGQACQPVGDDGQQVVEQAFGLLVDLPPHCAPAVVVDIGQEDVGVAAGGLNKGLLVFQELFENDLGGCGRPQIGPPVSLRAFLFHAGLDGFAQAAHDRLGLMLFVFRQALGTIDQRQRRVQRADSLKQVRIEEPRRRLAQRTQYQRNCKPHEPILTTTGTARHTSHYLGAARRAALRLRRSPSPLDS